LLGGAGVRESEPDHVHRQERTRLDQAAAPLGNDGRVEQARAGHRASTELLGQQGTEPADLGGLAQVVAVEPDRIVDELAHPSERAFRLNESSGGVP
jgi:hypothetical protein